MAKKQENVGSGTGEELFEIASFQDKVEPAVYAGVREQEGWQSGKRLSAEEFERAVARFMGC